MNYWLLCLPRKDMEHCIQIRTFGLARKNVIGHVQKGDKVVCCAGKGDWSIMAVGETTSDYFWDVDSIFLKEGVFPDRFSFKAERLRSELNILHLLDDLSFVSKPEYYAVFFRNGIVRASQPDWQLINEKIKR